ncbi:MAG: glutamyl-tRNA reductase [Desulfobacteraceae bacterium]|nr:glutamyl-tRNA reductase [Desulfobacteraceae bacterium]
MDKLILIGMNHKTAAVEIRECLAFSDEQTRKALVNLRSFPSIQEVILLSTCNRVELLICAGDYEKAVCDAKNFLAAFKGLKLNQFEDSLYLYQAEQAVRHLFRVSASLDSMVVGEPQILGQVKAAYRTATEEKTSGVILNRLLHKALFVAKRIRTETGIGGHAVSISYAAIELARKIFGGLQGKPVLLIGAGEMAELAVEHLLRNRAGTIFVANRTFDRGVELAARFKGTAIRFEEIESILGQVDIVISSTGARGYVLERSTVKGLMRGRRNRPVFFIDIAVPRDIDPMVNELNNVYVYDIDDLKGVIDENLKDRQREAIKAERVIDEAVIQFRSWFRELDVIPTIKALRSKIQDTARLEMQRTLEQMEHLSSEDHACIERMLRAFVNKILHEPTRYLKRSGCSKDRSASLDVARKLFGLDESEF